MSSIFPGHQKRYWNPYFWLASPISRLQVTKNALVALMNFLRSTWNLEHLESLVFSGGTLQHPELRCLHWWCLGELGRMVEVHFHLRQWLPSSPPWCHPAAQQLRQACSGCLCRNQGSWDVGRNIGTSVPLIRRNSRNPGFPLATAARKLT